MLGCAFARVCSLVEGCARAALRGLFHGSFLSCVPGFGPIRPGSSKHILGVPRRAAHSLESALSTAKPCRKAGFAFVTGPPPAPSPPLLVRGGWHSCVHLPCIRGTALAVQPSMCKYEHLPCICVIGLLANLCQSPVKHRPTVVMTFSCIFLGFTVVSSNRLQPCLLREHSMARVACRKKRGRLFALIA